jgi:hypothetical protein
MKYGSRKFIGWAILLVISTIALFKGIAPFIQWAGFNFSIFGAFCGVNVWQKKIETEQ